MIKQIPKLIAAMAFVVVGGLAATAFDAQIAHAACTGGAACVDAALKSVNPGNTTDLPGMIKTIINVLLFVIGAVSVIMIVVGGIKYTTSNGDSNAVKSAKDTILYAIIGVVVSLLAFAIVNFVVTYFAK